MVQLFIVKNYNTTKIAALTCKRKTRTRKAENQIKKGQHDRSLWYFENKNKKKNAEKCFEPYVKFCELLEINLFQLLDEVIKIGFQEKIPWYIFGLGNFLSNHLNIKL